MTLTEERQIITNVTNALDIAQFVLRDENLPCDPEIGCAVSQTLLVVFGMPTREAMKFTNHAVIHNSDERTALLVIKDAVQRLLDSGAQLRETE